MDIELEYGRFVNVTIRQEGVLKMDPKRAFLAGVSAGVDLHEVLASLTSQEFAGDKKAAHEKLVERIQELAVVAKKYKNAS